MSKRFPFTKSVAVVASLILLLTGCGGSTAPSAATGDAKPGNSTPTVKAAAVKRVDLTRPLLLSGKVTPAVETPVIAKYAGVVRAVEVEVGQQVEKGQVLVIQDTIDAELNAITAEASFQAGYEKAKTDYQVAQAQYERYRILYEQQAVAKSALEAEEQKAAAAKAVLESWNRQMVGGVPASVDLLKRKQSDMILRAPFSGIIAQKQVNPGEQVTATQTLMILVDMSKVYIDCNVAESDVGTLSMGVPIEAVVESTWQSYRGIITHISPIADSKTKTFLVRVTLENPDSKLKGGMYAYFQVNPIVRSGVLSVPSTALVENNGGFFVFVIKDDLSLERSKVEVGFRNETSAEIRAGLKEGQRVVAEAGGNLRDKMTVQIAATQASPQSGGKSKP